MDPPLEIWLLGLIGLALVVVYLLPGTKPKHEVDNPVIKLIDDLRHGVCGKCDAVHPEASRHGPNDFWTTFTCPECGYTVSAHVNEKDETTDIS